MRHSGNYTAPIGNPAFKIKFNVTGKAGKYRLDLKRMGESVNHDKFEEIVEDIHLATQADLAAEEDDDYIRFVDALNQLHLKQRLGCEGQARLKQFSSPVDDNLHSPQDMIKETLQLSVKSEEKAQIRSVCQKAIEVCQYSLALQSLENHSG